MEELEEANELLPTARNYTRHMLYEVHRGTLGELLSALYPCPLTYWEIGLRLKEEVKPDDSHPFKEWIEFYADPVVGDICGEFSRRIDALAEDAEEAERARMSENFLTSSRMEYMFWEMAYSLEGWPVWYVCSRSHQDRGYLETSAPEGAFGRLCEAFAGIWVK